MAEINLFGIRHHGAGSCRNLLAALEIFMPDIILVECPNDAESCLTYVALEMIEPPAAIMIYNPKDLKQYAYYPFTIFSPEWQAFQFGLKSSIPVRFFDLPQNQSFLISDRTTVSKKEIGFTQDPFGHMAAIAGFDDPERWWEEYIEQQKEAPEIFDTLLDLMIELRASDLSDKRSNLVREAFMRNQIRQSIKEGYKKIAVVCGAWHTPALRDLKKPTQSEDQAVLKGLKKTSAVYTWVPWSYSRIARHTGYSSGVISPYWYEALFTNPETAVARWMSRASRILDELGYPVSPAQSIESTRLAESLASIRRKSMPGLLELFDALTTVQVRGDESVLDQLRVKLLEGEKTGLVSDQVPTVPLLKDLEDQLKKVKLTRDWKKNGAIEKHFDLRKTTHLEASRLLHRMTLLSIDWGIQRDPEHNPLGTFHEYWDLEWYPEYEIQIIEASMWGNTVEDAAQQFILDQLSNEASFDRLGTLLYQVLHANLPSLVAPISAKIRDLGSLTEDILALMKIIPPLIWSLRYGDTAQINTAGIDNLLAQLYPRLCILMPAKTSDISEEVASETFVAQNNLNHALQLLDDLTFLKFWESALQQISELSTSNALIKGNSLRLLLIGQNIEESQLFKLVRYNLSSILDPFYPCHFLEGLLYGGGWLLIHKLTLRQIIDQWLLTLEEETFLTYLPILRRTFSTFALEEKEAIYQLLFSRHFREENPLHINEKRKDMVLDGLKSLL